MAKPTKKDAYIENPDIFIKLMNVIDSFIKQNNDNVTKVDEWVFDVENELQKTKELLEQRLSDARIKLENADRSLQLCLDIPTFDSEGRPKQKDCSSEKSARMRSKRQVDVAQKNLNSMNELLRYAQRFAKKYNDKKQKFMHLLDNKLPSNINELHKHHQIMQEYQNLNT